MRDRFGAVLTASMSMLFVEAVIGTIALFVWGQTQESPVLPYNGMGIFLLIVAVPLVAAVGAVSCALLTVGVVMPLLAVAGWLGRRLSGRATRVETFDFDSAVHKCTGTGTWRYGQGAGPWSQEVDVSIDDCSMDTWHVFGTPEHPKLFVYVGDPDSWDLYILQPRG
ncbi:hypothetical protein [Streptomyces sp. NPDC088135]|uniref:hypothetical protein n=1 Tax=Streptomyces sp. NPDC088135 TaxID=3160993 RepID=UPI00341A49DF